MLGDLLDWIAAIEQHTLVAIDIGDLRFATRRRGETGIVSEHSGLGIELADIDDRGTDRTNLDRHLDGGIADAKGAGRRAHGAAFLRSLRRAWRAIQEGSNAICMMRRSNTSLCAAPF